MRSSIDENTEGHAEGEAGGNSDYEMHIARLFEEHNQNLLRFVTARGDLPRSHDFR